MKRFMVALSVLAIVFFVAGCIFGNDDSNSEGDKRIDVGKSLAGTWSRYGSNNTTYHVVKFFTYNSDLAVGNFQKRDYTVNKDGSHTQTWTGSGQYMIELKEDGYEEDMISLNFWDAYGNLITTTSYAFSLNGNKLTLSGDVYAKE
ncbi:MAG: hypothetical protein WC445_04905 [Patescibacteria group bacterium]